jgi:hypothetical protein
MPASTVRMLLYTGFGAVHICEEDLCCEAIHQAETVQSSSAVLVSGR